MKIEKLKKTELDEYCKRLGIEITKKKKSDLIQEIYKLERAKIDAAIKSGNCLSSAFFKTGLFS